jgi:hypothetical protein
LFALKPEGDRYETALHFQSDTGTQIVVPHWFDDCVMLGRRLDTTPYSWPEPQVLQRTIFAPEAAEADKVRDRAASTQIPEEKRQLFRGVELQGKVLEKNGDHHLPEYETRDAWGGRKILLSVSLGLSPKTRQAVEAGIWRAGGTVLAYSENKGTGTEEEELNLVEGADVLVTRYRRGWPYINVRSDISCSLRTRLTLYLSGGAGEEACGHPGMGISRRVHGHSVFAHGSVATLSNP